MKDISNLQDLLIEQVREIYNAEKQELLELNFLKDKSNSKELRQTVINQKNQTSQQIQRLREVASLLVTTTFGENSEAMKGLIKECDELISRSADPEIMDAIIISTIQNMRHLSIAGYGTTCAYAKELGWDKIATLLHENLDEEKEMDLKLSQLAIDSLNKEAMEPELLY